MLDDSSLLYYNSVTKTDNGKITSNTNIIICHQGIALDEEFNERLIKSCCPYYYNKQGAQKILEFVNHSGN